MVKENLLYKTMSVIHVILFTSILCFGITFLSATLMMIPAMAAAFTIGKSFITKDFDINDSVVKLFFKAFKEALCLKRFILINLVVCLNVLGIKAASQMNMAIFPIICLMLAGMLLTLDLYIAGYYVFADKNLTLMEVVFCMLYKPAFMIPIFIGMVLVTYFFQLLIAKILLFMGTLFLFVVEMVIFLSILHYKKLKGMPIEEEYIHLVSQRRIPKINIERSEDYE